MAIKDRTRGLKSMKIRAFFFVWWLCSFGASTYAQASDNLKPAVWAWKLNHNGSVVYLLGELHKFISTEELNIDYALGEAAYTASSVVWIEALKLTTSNTRPPKKVSELLNPSTQKRMENAMFEAMAITHRHLTAEQRKVLLQKTLSGLDETSALASFVFFRWIADIKNTKNRTAMKMTPGMTMKLDALERKASVKKLQEIEPSDTVEKVWIEQCATSVDTEAVIGAALDYFDQGLSLENSLLNATLLAFFDPQISEPAYLKMTENGALSESLRKCSIVPRNQLWMSKIIQALETPGSTQSFLVGNNHMLGAGGLIELLKNRGYSTAQRIYKLE